MQQSPTKGIIPWAEVFALRYRNNSKKPLHVQVAEASASVTNARAGDELFLHEIKTDEIAVKLQSSGSCSSAGENALESSRSQNWNTGVNDDVYILLPSHYSGSFILYPRYPLNHCFLSVQEILDALPAVSRLIYSAEGFEVCSESAKAMERLEIIDQIRDSATGTEVLCVRSMKTEIQMLLPGTMRKPFVQLSNECFRCGSDGISASECIMRWKPGQPPLTVKIRSSKPRSNAQTLAVQKDGKQKKDKKEKKKKHSSCGDFEDLKLDNILNAKETDNSLIPDGWKDKLLSIKPFQRIRVQNIMFDAKDFTLPENAKLTVRIISENSQPASGEKASELCDKQDRPVSASGLYSGPLSELPVDLILRSKEPLRLMVTDGEMSTVLRQQLRLFQGCRLAVHQVKQTMKIVMVCLKNQRFLVSQTYSGTFKRSPSGPNSGEFRAEALLESPLPCMVDTASEDKSLGYDQLFRRNMLTATDTVIETTLYVEMFGADGQIVSGQPFEIPLSRTNLSVNVLDAKLPVLAGIVPIERVRSLPSVEFVTEAQVEALKNSMKQKRRDSDSYSSKPKPSHLSPDHPSAMNQNVGQTLNPQDDLYTRPVKTEKKKTNAYVPPAPPPRPPKAPGLSERSTRGQLVPPARPPKPDRYKGSPEKQSANFNFNSNVTGGTQQLSAVDQMRGRAKMVCERQLRIERTSLQDLEWCITENRKKTNAEISRLQIPEKSGIRDKTSGVEPVERPAALRLKSRASSFDAMHEKFNPRKYFAEEPLIQLADEPAVEITAFDNKPKEVGIYGECGKRSKQVSGFRTAWERAALNRSKRGTRIMNPNYATRIGEDIIDPALEKPQRANENDEENEPIYEFAADVREIRPALPSFSDDEDDYENPLSPLREHLVPEDEQYICMWQESPQSELRRITSGPGEEEYETPYEFLANASER